MSENNASQWPETIYMHLIFIYKHFPVILKIRKCQSKNSNFLINDIYVKKRVKVDVFSVFDIFILILKKKSLKNRCQINNVEVLINCKKIKSPYCWNIIFKIFRRSLINIV